MASEKLPPAIPPEVIEACRAELPIVRSYTYLNHAGVAPTSRRVVSAVQFWMEDLCEHGVAHEERWEAAAESARARFAELIGAQASEVAFVRNTSHGLGLVAEGLPWRAGDRVAVATDLEYPSNVYPWQHLASRGVEVAAIPDRGGYVDPADVAAALAPPTRLLAVSSTQYASGAVADLAALGRLCAERGVLFCVDGIQTVGALPLDVKACGIHFLSADSHKWMLGMPGIGGLFCDSSAIDQVRPALVGWKSTTGAWDFDHAKLELLPDARKLEEGSPAYALIAGFDAACGLLLEVGLPAIEARIRQLTARLAARLETLGCDVGPALERRAHIVTFLPPRGDVEALQAELAERRIIVSFRRGRFRASPHFYNTEAEVDHLADAVERFLAARPAG